MTNRMDIVAHKDTENKIFVQILINYFVSSGRFEFQN